MTGDRLDMLYKMKPKTYWVLHIWLIIRFYFYTSIFLYWRENLSFLENNFLEMITKIKYNSGHNQLVRPHTHIYIRFFEFQKKIIQSKLLGLRPFYGRQQAYLSQLSIVRRKASLMTLPGVALRQCDIGGLSSTLVTMTLHWSRFDGTQIWLCTEKHHNEILLQIIARMYTRYF